MVTPVELSSRNPTTTYILWGTSLVKTIVRAFVLVLTLTGSAAYTTLTFGAPVKQTVASTNMVPSCAPDDPNACGLQKR